MAQSKKTTKQLVLELLTSSQDEYINGQTIAKKLSLSRTAIWKAINALRNDGILIDAVTNKGYRLGEDNDILSSAAIKSKLNNDIEVICYQSIDSTNTEAKRLINQGKDNVFIVVANEQTDGRGRQGKSFYSPKNTGVYMSVVFHPNLPLQNTVGITTAAAVCVCRAIEKLSDKSPKIKWVNDVYLDNKKICGILTEAISDVETQKATSVIIGIGINITTPSFPKDIENAGALNSDIKRAELVAQVCNELFDLIKNENDDYISYYRSHSNVIGKRINIVQNGRILPATAIEIDDRGGLVVETQNGETQTLRSGEITLRFKE